MQRHDFIFYGGVYLRLNPAIQNFATSKSQRGKATVDVHEYVISDFIQSVCVFDADGCVMSCCVWRGLLRVVRSVEMGNAKALYWERAMTVSHVFVL